MTIQYPARDAVSVWVGNFSSENDFDRCVDGPICATLGLKVELARVCEVSYQDKACSIKLLLKGFSGWESFAEQALQIADSRELRAANAALVCYYVKCDNAPEKWDRMDFLGTFAGSDIR